MIQFYLLNGISTFMIYVKQNTSFLENMLDSIWPISGEEEVHAFPKGISPKVNVITQLEVELAYFEMAF